MYLQIPSEPCEPNLHYTNTADDEFGRLVVQDKRKWVIDNGESVVYGGDLSVHSCVHCDSVQDRI